MSEGEDPPTYKLRLGSLNVPVWSAYHIDQFKKPSATEGWHLFNDGQGIAEWRQELRGLGIPDDLDVNENQIFDIIKDALGVVPDASDETNKKASYAWALVNFAVIDRQMRQLFEFSKSEAHRNAAEGHFDLHEEAVKRAAILGRIIEWWRWRSTGRDAFIVKKMSTLKAQKAAGHSSRSPDHDRIISAMVRRIENDEGPTEAARNVHLVDGLGSSPIANLSRWKKYKGRS